MHLVSLFLSNYKFKTNQTNFAWSPPHILYKYRPGCGSVTLVRVKPELRVSESITNSPKGGPGRSVCKRRPSTYSLLSLPILRFFNFLGRPGSLRWLLHTQCRHVWVCESVCVCICVDERERERRNGGQSIYRLSDLSVKANVTKPK